MKAKKILHLTLHRKWFDAIARGAKTEEFRAATPFWEARLEGKAYDEVHFRNGYSLDKPFLRASCVGIERHPHESVYVIHLGKILEIRNYAD